MKLQADEQTNLQQYYKREVASAVEVLSENGPLHSIEIQHLERELYREIFEPHPIDPAFY